MKKLYMLVGVLLTVVLVIGSSGCAKPVPAPTPSPTPKPTPTSTPAPHPTVALEVLGAAVGTGDYSVMVGVADILSKYHPWIRASVVATTGTAANITMGAKRDPNTFVLEMAQTSYRDALAGRAPFDRAYPEPRFIAGFNSNVTCFFGLDPKIKTPQDLIGKKVALTPAVWGSTRVWLEILKIWGISDKITTQHMDYDSMYNALRDGLVDVAVASGTGPDGYWTAVPAVQELIATKGKQFGFVPLDSKTVKEAVARTNQEVGVGIMPPGTMGPAQTAPLEVMSYMVTTLGGFAGASNELIYEITKAIAQNYNRFESYYPPLRGLTPEIMVHSLPIKSEDEVHPGALKYYKEVGLWAKASPLNK